VAVLHPSAEPVSTPAGPDLRRLHTAALLGAALALVFALVPPLLTLARRYVYVETIQFGLLAYAVPALVVLGWPARLLRGRRGGRMRAFLGRVAFERKRHPDLARSLAFAGLDAAAVIVWRTPPLMDALQRHGWLLAVEVLSLAVCGVLVWTELVRSPPIEPRLHHPWRGVLAAVSMWSIWVMAYVVGFSHVSWYVAFHHSVVGLGASADQEISTGVLWFSAVCAFVPVVFSDLMAWLRKGEDPDAELRRIVRRERWWGRWG
jgi:cytochrome c oxidase assembly factor CtaG